jgi:hypothetical protein
MRTTLCLASALLACAIMTAGCATSRPDPVKPPRLTLPDAALKACVLPVLPADPTTADLDAAYLARGAQIVACDGARRLAVETLTAERRLTDEWLKIEERRRQGWLGRLVPG